MEAIGKMHGLELCNANADWVFLLDNGKTANVSHAGMVICSNTSIRNGRYRSVLAVHPTLSSRLISRLLL